MYAPFAFRHLFAARGCHRRLFSTSTLASNRTTVREAIFSLTKEFEAAAVPEPKVSAALLVGRVMDVHSVDDLEKSMCEEPVGEKSLTRLEAMARCRIARMPVQYIVGSWDFRELCLQVKPPVFIPRPETEELVSLVIEYMKAMPSSEEATSVLEIGCGSGAIALSLLKELKPRCLRIVAIDRSRAACSLTMENAVENETWEHLTVLNARLNEDGAVNMLQEGESHRLRDHISDSGAEFGVIVSNPPYVLRKDLFALEPEITLYEDLRALDGGANGLSVILPILKFASHHLSKHGKLFLEVDPCHPLLLKRDLKSYEDVTLDIAEVRQDFRGKDRFMIFKRC